ncbi:hypothetical protein TNCV_1622771 [Trichonephila clavipes]|nr:hypothetical protein TNCV_1622771 [Trichonephila clavipes]
MKMPPQYSHTSESVEGRTIFAMASVCKEGVVVLLIGGVASSESDNFGCCIKWVRRLWLMHQVSLTTLVAASSESDNFGCSVKRV